MGSVRRVQGSQFWQLRYVDQNGNRREQSSKTTNYKKALQQLRKIEGSIADGKHVTPESQSVLVSDLLQGVVDDYRLTGKRTVDDLIARCNLHLIPFLGNIRAATLQTATVRQYTEARQNEGAKNGTIKRELTALKRAFKLATQDGLLFTPPYIPMLPEAAPRSGFFTREHVLGIKKNLLSHYADVVEFAYWTGWRRGEICGLEWRHIDFDALEIRLYVGEGKDRKAARVFPMIRELRLLLEKRWALTRQAADTTAVTPMVFWYIRKGEIAPVKQFDKSCRKACIAAGAPGRVFHDFRRTAYKRLATEVGEHQAMKMVGWSRRETADRYFAGATALTDIVDLRRRLDGEVSGEVAPKTGDNSP